MASTNFTDGATTSAAAWANDIDAAIYEQTGVGKTTIASATTPDIFAVTTGRLIDYTGTATCTGFVDAVSAGSSRVLYCAGACLFTAGANLLIEGIPSGTTITLGTGAIVKVYAITTTQFKMTYSLSGTFTATGTGFTVNPTGTAIYKIVDGWVSLSIPFLIGTSNASTFTITGLPDVIMPTTKYLPIIIAQDNGVATTAALLIATPANTITIYKTLQGMWTTSGSKAIYGITDISYSIL